VLGVVSLGLQIRASKGSGRLSEAKTERAVVFYIQKTLPKNLM